MAHWGEHIAIEDTVAVLHRDGTATKRYHVVTQLSGTNELAAWDEVFRTYNPQCELHSVLQARLLMPGGSWRRAEVTTHPVAIQNGQHNVQGRGILIRFQPLRPGVVLELEEAYDGFRWDEFGPTLAHQFFLQTGAPCQHRRFVVAVAKPFELQYRLHHGAVAPVETQTRDYRVYTWEVRHAEGAHWDEWMPPARDCVPWIDVSTATTWNRFASRFRDELEPPLRTDPEVVAMADDLAKDKNTPLEKAAAAYTYVSQSVRYGRPPVEAVGRNIRKAEQMLQDLRGDCKDKSALLVQLLRRMKLDARIAVVLTGDAGRTPFLPSARFNHALVRLEHDGEVRWLDAASGPFSFGELPDIDLEIPALVLGRDTFHIDRIARPSEALRETRLCQGTLNSDGNYEFAAERTFTGETSAQLRMQLSDRSESHRLRVLQAWLGSDYPGAVGWDFTTESVDDLSQPFSYRCRAQLDGVARRIKDLYLLGIPWALPLAMSGPMSAKERKEPLVVPINYHVFERHEIALPEGVAPYAVPEAIAVSCAWGHYRCHLGVEDRRLICEREMRLAGTLVSGDQFLEYREFWRQCTWADAGQVVLRDVAAGC